MCPPGVDQTCRSAQQWTFLVPRLKEKIPLNAPDTYGSLPAKSARDRFKGYDGYLTWDSWSRLVKLTGTKSSTPLSPVFKKAPKTRPSRRSSPRLSKRLEAIPLSNLELLPAELVQHVIDQDCLDEIDVISLGLASPVLWQHMLSYIALDSRRSVGQWAGQELIITGTHLTDLPAPLMADKIAEKSVGDEVFDGWGQMCYARQFNWAALYEYDEAVPSPSSKWVERVGEHEVVISRFRGINKLMTEQQKKDIDDATTCLPTSSSEWVLKNLTTHEYIRCRPFFRHGPPKSTYAATKAPQAPSGSWGFTQAHVERKRKEMPTTRALNRQRGFVNHPDAPWMRIDELLLTKICWGDEKSLFGRQERFHPERIGQGDWAGHRFEITPCDADFQAELDEQPLKGGWRDVTSECVQEALKYA